MLEGTKQWVKKRPALFRFYLWLLDRWKLFRVTGLNLSKARLFRQLRPYTMVPYEGLSSLLTLCVDVERRNLGGAYVECGVWNGGCSALMARTAKRSGHARRTWLFDSFEGVPEPVELDGAEAKRLALNNASGRLKAIGHFVGALKNVETILFREFRIDPERVQIVKGWFQDTLPSQKDAVGPIALLRLDGDWFESTKVCLETLYDNVVSGGYVVIDDYGHWEGCRKAVDAFFLERKIQVDLKPAGYSVVYFQKP
ncbi:MAG: class I SAM-dependent methyltransferase [Elusimicrobia bacterium]|nr:class I SAM-dependent methyltransferase [Elusimicrobiota bacterium]